jgi:hypothetical protein
MLPCLVNSTRCPFPTIPSSQRNPSALAVSSLFCSDLFLFAFDSELSTVNCLLVTPSPVCPEPLRSIPARALHLTESTANLNPTSANLDAASTISPLLATLTQNTRGWGYRLTPSPLLAEYFLLSSHPPFANSFRIRTYEKRARNSRRIRTSKTQDLKRLCLHPAGVVGCLNR